MTDYKALSNEELNALAATRVMGFTRNGGDGQWEENGSWRFYIDVASSIMDGEQGWKTWNPCEDHNHSALLLEKVGEKKKGAYFSNFLWANSEAASLDEPGWGVDWAEVFTLLTATPRQKTEAALMAWGEG